MCEIAKTSVGQLVYNLSYHLRVDIVWTGNPPAPNDWETLFR